MAGAWFMGHQNTASDTDQQPCGDLSQNTPSDTDQQPCGNLV